MKIIRLAAGFGPKRITVSQLPKFSANERDQWQQRRGTERLEPTAGPQRPSWKDWKVTMRAMECERRSAIPLRGLQERQQPRVSQDSSRRQRREPLVKQMTLQAGSRGHSTQWEMHHTNEMQSSVGINMKKGNNQIEFIFIYIVFGIFKTFLFFPQMFFRMIYDIFKKKQTSNF